jgi:predicted O-methyltransferase YrrM
MNKESKILQMEELTHWAGVTEGNAVEIGSLYGRSAIAIARGLKKKKSGKVFTIDPHIAKRYSDYDLFLSNISKSGVSEYIYPIRDYSSNVLKNKQPKELFDSEIGLLFIDGDHSYSGVKTDLEWIKFVKEGGVVFFHDYYENPVVNFAGVKKAVDEYLQDNNDLKLLKFSDGLITFKKVKVCM